MERQWHLEKSISVGHIITTVTVALGAIWWAAKLETRINILDNNFQGLQSRLEVTDRRIETVRIESNAQMLQIKSELQQQLDRIDHKLDRIMSALAERQK